jgi:hypothetical protein
MRVSAVGGYGYSSYYTRTIEPARKQSEIDHAQFEIAWRKIKPTHTHAQFLEWKVLNADKFVGLDGMKFPQMMEVIDKRFDSMFAYQTQTQNALYS